MPPCDADYLSARLAVLRPMLPDVPGDESLRWFDEFVREHEFDLALHVVCDYLIGPDGDPASSATVEKIRELHAAMKIEDDCVEQLAKKRQVK